jgi:hypothetical protein
MGLESSSFGYLELTGEGSAVDVKCSEVRRSTNGELEKSAVFAPGSGVRKPGSELCMIAPKPFLSLSSASVQVDC